jgi:Coenzyme PQQ synthesis protein D (PqqD)
MMFANRRPRITRQEQLQAKPLRVLEPETTRREDGGVNLKVPLKTSGFARWLPKVSDVATKTFELDEIGFFVWEAIDGNSSIQQVIRKLSKRYGVSLREAEVSTLAFLNVLTRKGLIAMQLNDRLEKKRR